jgi:hypothetical protein
MSLPFRTKCCANHYVYQAISNGKLRLKEQRTRLDKYCFNITPHALDPCTEALLFQCSTYIWDHLPHKILIYFLLAAFISTLKIAKPDAEDTESAKVYKSVVLP